MDTTAIALKLLEVTPSVDTKQLGEAMLRMYDPAAKALRGFDTDALTAVASQGNPCCDPMLRERMERLATAILLERSGRLIPAYPDFTGSNDDADSNDDPVARTPADSAAHSRGRWKSSLARKRLRDLENRGYWFLPYHKRQAYLEEHHPEMLEFHRNTIRPWCIDSGWVLDRGRRGWMVPPPRPQ